MKSGSNNHVCLIKCINGLKFGKKVMSRRLKSLKIYFVGCWVSTPKDGGLNYGRVGKRIG